MKVITNPHLTEEIWKQTKWPRTHKNKWRVVKKFFQKYYKCFQIPSTDFYIMTDPFTGMKTIICHPMMYDRLRNEIGGLN